MVTQNFIAFIFKNKPMWLVEFLRLAGDINVEDAGRGQNVQDVAVVCCRYYLEAESIHLIIAVPSCAIEFLPLHVP